MAFATRLRLGQLGALACALCGPWLQACDRCGDDGDFLPFLSPLTCVDLCAGPDAPPDCTCYAAGEAAPPGTVRWSGCPECQGAVPDPECENAPAADAGLSDDAAMPDADAAPDTRPDAGSTPDAGSGWDAGASPDTDAATGADDAAADATTLDAEPAPECDTDDDCGGAMPACLRDAGVCVECTASTDCAGGACDPADHTCVECLDDADCGAGRCLADRRVCVECLNDADCVDPNVPRCTDAHACAGCESDEDCAHLGRVCDEPSGACVDCTTDTEEARCPGGQACHPSEHTCTGAMRGSLEFCEACVSDSECASGTAEGVLRCVPHDFGAAPHGSYCALDLASYREAIASPTAVCPNKLPLSRLRTSVGGVSADYCIVREALTTCEAVRDFTELCTDDADCGAEALDDGVCHGRCSYLCAGSADCATGTACMGPVGAQYCAVD